MDDRIGAIMDAKQEKSQATLYVERNRKLVENAQTLNYGAWHLMSQEGYRFANNIQLTASEKKELREAGMPDFTINKITPTIELARFFVTNNDPRWIPSGFQGNDTEKAHIVDTMTERAWYLSDGTDIIFRVVTDIFQKSLGYFYIYVDPNMDFGKGEVLYDHVNSWNVFSDPMSKNKLGKDAMWMIIKDDVARSRLMNEHPDKDEQKKIMKAQSGHLYENYFTYMGVNHQLGADIEEGEAPTEITHEAMAYKEDGSPDDILDRYRGFFRVKKQYWNVFIQVPPTEEEIKIIKLEVQGQSKRINEELDVRMKEEQLKLDQALQSEQIIEERHTLSSKRLKSETVKQKKIMFENLLNEALQEAARVEVKLMSDKEWKLYEKKGEFRKYVISKKGFYQDAIEMCLTIGDQFIKRTKVPGKHIPLVPVHYIYTGTPFPISLASMLVGKQKEMNKAHQLIIHNANLGSNLRWMFKIGSIDEEVWRKYSSSPGALLPVKPGQDFPKELMPLPLSNAFVYLTEKAGADFHFLSGMSAGAQGVENEQPETFKGMKANDEMGTRRIRDWVHNMFDPALTHVGQIFMAFAKALYTEEKIMRVATEDYEKEVTINQKKKDLFGNITEILNALDDIDDDIKAVPGSTLPSNREQKFQNALIMRREGIVDDEEVIRHSDIKDKKDLIERKTKLARTTQANKQLQTTIKELNGDIETLKRMVLTARLKADEKEMSTKLMKTLLEAQSRIRKGELKSEADIEKATDEYKLTLEGMLKDAEYDIQDLTNEKKDDVKTDEKTNKK